MRSTTIRASFIALGLVIAYPATDAFAECAGSIIDEPGDYSLCWDHINEPIRITASDVRLNCFDHKVWTTADPAGPTEPCNGTGRHGIWIEKAGAVLTNVIIERCNVAGWDSGIRAVRVSGLSLVGNVATKNWDGFDVNYTSNVFAQGNNASNNGGFCDAKGEHDGEGIDIDVVDHAAFLSNTASGNKGHGVSLSNVHDQNPCSMPRNFYVNFKNSSVSNNFGFGFNIRRTNSSSYEDNHCSGNGRGNVRASDCNSNLTFDMPGCR